MRIVPPKPQAWASRKRTGPGCGAPRPRRPATQGQRAEHGAVQRDRERAEQAPPAGLAAAQGVSAAAGCGR